MDRKEFDLAIKDLTRAILLSPNRFENFLAMGHCYQAMDEPANARKNYIKALELEPDNEDIQKAIAKMTSQTTGDSK